jgi:hypothetical protein
VITSSLTRRIGLRRATNQDLEELLEVCRRAWNWGDDPSPGLQYIWQHLANPFGTSPTFVVTDGDDIVAVQPLLRWRLRHHSDRTVEIVRPTAPAILPSHRDRPHLLDELARVAIEEVTEAGAAGLLSTVRPHQRASAARWGGRPVGQVAITVRPRSARTLTRLRRTPANAPTEDRDPAAGLSVPIVLAAFAQDLMVANLLARRATPSGWTTDLTPAVFRWRYSAPHVHHRIELLGRDLRGGLVVFRAHHREPLIEVVIDDVLAPRGGLHHVRPAVRRILEVGEADVAVAASVDASPRLLRTPLRHPGPTLLWRPLNEDLDDERSGLHLSLGALSLT